MRRDLPLIPLYLWVSASICVHIASYVGSSEVALRWRQNHPPPSASARGNAVDSAPPSEVEFTYVPPPPTPATPDLAVPPPENNAAADPEAMRVRREQQLARVAPPPPTPTQQQQQPPPLPTPQTPATPAPPPPPVANNMQSVDQENHDNEARPDNPAVLAQSNHHVEDQTVAAALNLNHNDPHPQLGGAPTHNNAEAQGNGERSVSADDRDRAGERRAPQTSPNPALHPNAGAPRLAMNNSSSGNAAAGSDRRPGRAGERGAAGREGAAGTAGAAASETTNGLGENTMTAANGTGGLVPIGTGIPMQNGQGGGGGQGGRGGQNGQGGDAGTRVGVAGMGAARALNELTPTQTTYNQVFGPEAERERRVAQLRRSQARGSFTESWRENRAAIENYTPSIRVGNQTALRTASSPFAAYLTAMHRRIHRLFADGFIEGLAAAPANSPLNDQSLVTTVEIVLQRDGRLHRLGVARTSGNMAFDVAALNSVRRAAPFGGAPDAIVSGDGNVYVRWRFHRDENACGTWNAEPYIIPTPGGPAPAAPGNAPRGPAPRDEHPPRAPSTVGQREPSAVPGRERGNVSSVEGLPIAGGTRVAIR